MKGSREEKRYIAKNLKRLKACSWDDINIIMKFPNCKKYYKRKKAMRKKEYIYGID